MGSQGNTFNVAVNPQGAKQLLDAETFAPNQLEMRNGVRTDAGNWKSRPGYAQEWSLGVQEAVTLLIPVQRSATSGLGFAVTSTGKIYEVLPSQAVQLYTGPAVNGTFQPTWEVFDGIPIVCSGQAPVKILVDQPAGVNTTELLALGTAGGDSSGDPANPDVDPPAAKFISVISDRVVLSGQNDTTFTWSSAGNADLWPQQNFSNVTGNGQRIRNQKTLGTNLYFFKDFDIEVWGDIGGVQVFGRSAIINVLDRHRAQRGLQGFSVVLAGDPSRFFFYADGDFWVLNGASPQRISTSYKREIGLIPNVDGIYGYDCAKEHVIRWFEPVSGRCFVFDYLNNNFTEDNAWINGAWQRLPVYSYMEMQDRAYVGDYDPTGLISHWADTIPTDQGHPIRVYRKLRFPLAMPGSNPLKASTLGHRARWNRLQIRLERGQGTIGSNPTLQVNWAIDGAMLTPDKSLSLGEATLTTGESGSYNPYLEIRNLGTGREALVELIQYASVRHLLTHLTITTRAMGR